MLLRQHWRKPTHKAPAQHPLPLLCLCWASVVGSHGGQQHQSCMQSLAPCQEHCPAAHCQCLQRGQDQQCQVETFLRHWPCQRGSTCLLVVA